MKLRLCVTFEKGWMWSRPLPPDSVWSAGTLAFVDNQVDAATGTVLIKGEFPNHDGSLWPGAFVPVRLRLRQQSDALVVPASAVTNSM